MRRRLWQLACRGARYEGLLLGRAAEAAAGGSSALQRAAAAAGGSQATQRRQLWASPRLQHAAADDDGGGGGSWLPSFIKSRLPRALGGTKEKDELEDMTLDAYAKSLKRARTLGGLTGFVHGTGKAADAAAQGSMRLYESIIEAMTEEERQDLALFDQAARERVAATVGCRTVQVDDCIAKYLWMRDMGRKLAAEKKAGRPLPTSVEELERQMGTWRQYKSESGAGGAEGPTVRFNARGPGGQPCPLAGTDAGRNTKCPLTRKSFKSCCGKRLLVGKK